MRFIFSRSALREGWDNPNIFQICTLKESGSETSKRQEVGRGLRLCVDQDGVRLGAQLLGADEVQRVNVLIASESYETFVRGLQSDIRSTLRERPQKVEIDFFSGKTLEVEGEDVAFSDSDSKAIYKHLLKNDFLDDADRPSEAFRTMVGEGKFQASVRRVFFVAETKGTMDTMEISGVEKAKIRCAERLFDEASTSDVRYH